MKTNLLLSAMLLLLSCTLIRAQEWSKEDSIWLQNVLEGKETLKINDNTKKAIEEGRLIVPPWLKDTISNYNLEKNFDDAGIPDSIRFRNLDPYSMPPAVYALYVLYVDKMDSMYQVKSLIITDDERKMLESLVPTGTERIYLHSSGSSGGITTDFNHALSMLFSAHYRQLAYNRRHAAVYKYDYNGGERAPSIRFSERERQHLNRSAYGTRIPIRVSTGSKTNGIDN